MALFFTITLLISIAGMLGILALKRHELRTGRVFLVAARPRLTGFFRMGLFWIERVLPSLVAREIGHLWAAGRAALRTALARALVFAERLLERGLGALRGAMHTAARPGEASLFLREVAEHKKKLQEEASNE